MAHEEILDALCELVADEGLSAVSIRTVATRAGVSPAQVQYHFRSKAELVAGAHRHVMARFEARLAQVPQDLDPLARLRWGLHAWLPDDELQLRDVQVWLAFSAAAASSEALRETARRVDRELLGMLEALLGQAQERGDLPPALDPGELASQVLAQVDGLAMRCAVHATVGDVHRVLDAVLDRMVARHG